MSILEVKNISKRFPGVMALNNVSLSIEKDEIRGLIGPNGSGKTTLLKTITGFYKQDQGVILFYDQPILHDEIWTRVNNGLNLTYQNPKYVPGLSIYRHIELGTLSKNGSHHDIVKIADKVGLRDKLDEDPSELPAYSAKLLEVAKALATKPKLLMLDEIFAGLSYEEGEKLIEMLKNIKEDMGLTILLIDHNLKMVKMIVENTTVLNMGEVIADGPFGTIIEDQNVKNAYIG